MVSPQTILIADISLAGGALVCLVRLYSLQLCSAYPALSWFFFSQVFSTLTAHLLGPRTTVYQWVYLALLTAELVIDGFLIREIYDSIFKDFPGIAVVGRWSLFLSLFLTGWVVVLSVLARSQMSASGRFNLMNVEMVAHCLTFGYAALLLTILVAISRYPLRLHKNVLVNTLLFGAILLGEALGLIAEQLTARRYTESVNFVVSVSGILCFSFWVMLLSREGQTRMVHLRRGKDFGDETRLLIQLGAINSILLRAKVPILNKRLH